MGKLRLIIGIIFIAPMFVLLGVLSMIFGGLLWALRLRQASYAVVHFILGWLIGWIYFFLGVRVKVEGRENIPRWGEKVCYVPNHSSMLDIPVLFGSGMWCGLVAKKELFKVPVLHGLLRTLHCVPIDRSSLREGFKSIVQGAERIESGYPMGIFPEGTRSRTGEMAENLRIVHVYVKILPPIDTAEMSPEELKNVHTVVEDEIRNTLKTLPGPYGRH